MKKIERLNESKLIKAANNTIKKIVKSQTNKFGNNANLNHIDVSEVTSIEELFGIPLNSSFNGDISGWNTKNFKIMWCVFDHSNFNGDISQWNTENVEDLGGCFYSSKFNGDISQWNTQNVWNMGSLFSNSPFNGDISLWNVENVVNMYQMFWYSDFNGDLSKWKPISLKDCIDMFNRSPLNGKEPLWYHCLQWGLFKSGEDFFDSMRYDWLRGETIVIGRLERAIKDFEGSLDEIHKIMELKNFNLKQ